MSHLSSQCNFYFLGTTSILYWTTTGRELQISTILSDGDHTSFIVLICDQFKEWEFVPVFNDYTCECMVSMRKWYFLFKTLSNAHICGYVRVREPSYTGLVYFGQYHTDTREILPRFTHHHHDIQQTTLALSAYAWVQSWPYLCATLSTPISLGEYKRSKKTRGFLC